jgi:hypothetical protein
MTLVRSGGKEERRRGGGGVEGGGGRKGVVPDEPYEAFGGGVLAGFELVDNEVLEGFGLGR